MQTSKPTITKPAVNHWFDTGLGKLPPQAIEIESAVLGACMLEKEAVETALSKLKDTDFYKEANQYVFKAIQMLSSTGNPVDLRTVTQQLRTMAKLEYIGGGGYLIDLVTPISSGANIEYHTRIVLEHSLKRALIAQSSGFIRDGYDETKDVFDLLHKAEKAVYELTSTLSRGKQLSFYDQQVQAFTHLEKVSKTGFIGVPSKWSAVNRLTGGYERATVTVVAARPSMGKSLFMVNEALAMIMAGYSVMIFSLEMVAKKQIYRLWSLYTGILHEHVQRAHILKNPADIVAIQNCIQFLAGLLFELNDTATINIQEIRSACRKRKSTVGLDVVFIDYIGLLEVNDNGRNHRAEQIAEITRGLKNMANELDISVIELCQLSRKVEDRPGSKIPILSDLRDSGSVEQDADQVFFLYRPEYYKISALSDGTPTDGLEQVVIAKSRDGKLDTVNLSFQPKISLITDWFDPRQNPSNQMALLPDSPF